MITLNTQQQAAHDQLVAYLTGEDTSRKFWLLKGYAGTGKTTTIGTVIKSVMEAKRGGYLSTPTIAISAPTHKAVQVLKRMRSFDGDVMYATIHSLLGLKEHIDNATGKQSFQRDTASKYMPPIDGVDILIVDEVSMLNNELFMHIIPYVNNGLKLVLMGDPVQIPPVNETDPVPFTSEGVKKYNIGVMELTDIVRQAAHNPILLYATALREIYKTGDIRAVSAMYEGTGVDVMPFAFDEKLQGLLDKYFNCEDFRNDPDHAKVIAWTNATVNNINGRIRELIYGPMPRKIMVGEKLICDKPVMRSDTVILSANTEIEVLSYEILSKTIGFTISGGIDHKYREETFRYYRCTVRYNWIDLMGELRVRQEIVDIIHEDSEQAFHKMQGLMKNCILENTGKTLRGMMWKKFYANDKQFAWVKYNYAITAHKSQGSTYGIAIVLEWDINKNRKTEERNRIKYVAATRPSRLLHIVI